MCNKDQILSHLEHIVNLSRSVHLKRVLTATDAEPKLNFWRVIYGGLLDLAVLEWCKLFGANGEPTHWKELVDDHDTFRDGLFDAVGISREQWDHYWSQMKSYRDDFVAHDIRETDVENYPELDVALESCYFYYDYLINKLRGLGDPRFPDDLREYCERFSTQARKVAQTAIGSTSGMGETVY